MSDLVYLKCVKEGSKLRIKIISPGYHNEANCQFPKNIRLPGRKYSVPRYAISFAEGPNHKFFYRISKSQIKIVSDAEGPTSTTSTISVTVTKVFEDTTTSDCVVCMSTEKDVVFASCGHYCACYDCATTIKTSTGKCPICRSIIIAIVKRESIQI
jgi:hypothetical protein